MRQLVFLFILFPAILFGQKVYLIGDAGEPKDQDKNLVLLKEKVAYATPEDYLIFLGDNLYPKGLPEKEHPEREELEQKLISQLDVMKVFPGKAYMVPGNHDWAQGRNYGWERALNMERFVQDYQEGTDAFHPTGGCPGPIEIPMNDKSTLIILNTQYFLHGWDKPDEDDNCENKSAIEALEDLKTIVRRNKGKHILIAAHHPIFTYGEHHGNFSFKDQMKPPVLGSLQPLFRRLIGNIQDVTHPKYRAIMKQVISAMNEAESVVYAAGHEHSLQFIQQEGHHFIVSGSGSKTTHVKQGKGSLFAKSEQGFAVLTLENSGKASVEYWGVDGGLLYEKEVYSKQLQKSIENINMPDFSDSTITVVASKKYEGKEGKDFWLGANYRDVWNTPVEVDVFDLGVERGGLEVVKKGGGMQTKSLRLSAKDEKEYVLRSIEKYPENAIPTALQKTFAQDIVEDQISASHPYAAFIIPPLAEAAHIYHTNPKPVYIPDDPRLGQFRSTFAGTLALYEERPNEAASRDAHFGGGEDIDGTDTVIENLKEDNDNAVDQNFVVRNRLFDMWIGDWDRHDDQWRWAQIDQENGNLYRPIPRDRDQAFFINEGIIPKLAARKWALPKIEGFDEEVDWAPGISQNARFFDRTFMNEPDWNDWLEQIDFLQKNLTDEVIDQAISLWPEQIQSLTGDRIRTGLQARRANMESYARELYLFLSKEVEVTGSDKHEYFLVEHLTPSETKVTVRKRKKDGEVEHVIYERIFKSDETKEVRLYGFDGEDVFEVKGQSSKIKVRIIGGTDKDLIINGNADEKLKKVKVYDRYKSTRVQGNSKGILKLSNDPAINRYNRKAFQYDVLMPLVTAALNPDDGIFLGGGFSYTKHGWRKEPFAAKHSFKAIGAFETGSYQFDYTGDYTDVLGKWDLNTSLLWQEPFFVNNFFGISNESEFLMDQFVAPDDDPIDYYRVRMDRLELNAGLSRNVGAKAKFYLSSGYKSVEVEASDNRFITDQPSDGNDFKENQYARFKTGISFDSRDSKVLTTAGMTAFAEVEHLEAITDFSESSTRLSAEWAFYLTAKLPSRLVIANRLGASHITSDQFDFFNANILGGRTNLRGFRRTRFYGETSFYHNLDLRLKLASFRSYIFPGQFGLLAFHDTGRVWVDGEDSDEWHAGKGFGLWISPLNTLVLNFNYAFGEEENLPTFSMSFFF
ncbi:Calcineurin-like phosphoesterase [Ekhidna lutea]|uniref:Calcineurin-like phosphoesterase n=1 Tax=Ekhidna lutea TaxID=447679 RepID=A0A239IEI2_EKHLU|nr:BamA/TamA family outer membrane protein [Ekhidna lutea]SNS91842.1 Calcineurin-like phosphoesterase [Ekhidna lutea]